METVTSKEIDLFCQEKTFQVYAPQSTQSIKIEQEMDPLQYLSEEAFQGSPVHEVISEKGESSTARYSAIKNTLRVQKATTHCPGAVLLIKFPGIQSYPLAFLLDTGAGLNIARHNAFLEDAWREGKTDITFGNNEKSYSHKFCIAPVQLGFEEKPLNTLFVHFEVEDYDGVIGSNTLSEWEPFIIDKDFLTLKGLYQLPRIYQPTSFSRIQKNEKIKKPVNQVWLHQQFQERNEELKKIKEVFASSVMTKDLKKF